MQVNVTKLARRKEEDNKLRKVSAARWRHPRAVLYLSGAAVCSTYQSLAICAERVAKGYAALEARNKWPTEGRPNFYGSSTLLARAAGRCVLLGRGDCFLLSAFDCEII